MIAPVALLLWQAFGRDRNRAAWFIKTILVGAYLAAITIAGLWLVAPWYVSVLYLLVLAGLILSAARQIRQLAPRPECSRDWTRLGIRSVVAICSLWLLLYALSGRQPPTEDVVNLHFHCETAFITWLRAGATP